MKMPRTEITSSPCLATTNQQSSEALEASDSKIRENEPAFNRNPHFALPSSLPKPVRNPPHLNTRPRRDAGRTRGIIERRVRHAVRLPWIGVIGFEHQRLIDPHAGEIRPAMRRVVAHDPAL